MKFIEGSIRLSEEQSILYCVKKGLSTGEEFETQAWVKRGCLKLGDGTHKRLVSNLECCAEEVLVEGKGRKRVYILNGIYDVPLVRLDGRINNGYALTEEESSLDEYIFNKVLENEYIEHMSYSKWAEVLGFFNYNALKSKNNVDTIKKNLNSLHKDTFKYNLESQKEILDTFENVIRDRGNSVVSKAFSRLEDQGRISIEEKYVAKRVNSGYIELSRELYDYIMKEENAILEIFGSDRASYLQKKLGNNLRDENYYMVSNAIKAHLRDTYQIEYYYIARLPIIINKYMKVCVLNGVSIFYKRLFHLTKRRQLKYTDHNEVVKKWYLANTYTILKSLGITIPEEELHKETINIKRSAKFSFSADKEFIDSVDEACDFL